MLLPSPYPFKGGKEISTFYLCENHRLFLIQKARSRKASQQRLRAGVALLLWGFTSRGFIRLSGLTRQIPARASLSSR
jgi:hypothetical protein